MIENLSTMMLSTAPDASLWALVEGTGWMVRFVLLLLVLASVASWAIIGFKAMQITKMANSSKLFQDAFWQTRRLDKIYEICEEYAPSPMVEIFRAGYMELARIRKAEGSSSEGPKRSETVTEDDIESIERSLRKAHSEQMNIADSMVSFLATIGSAAPFVGLFGTVWGIMNSFQEIGVTQNASLATVAPGISEALIATATGLAAAIPAVIAYNYFIERNRILETEMENFSRDFLNIIKRHFFR